MFYSVMKSTKELRNKDLTGLVEFRKDYPEARVLMLYMGRERLKIRDVDCVPCEEFLKALLPSASMEEVGGCVGTVA